MTSRPANVRDLGGLPLVGGGTTAHGVLLRGDALYDGDDPPAGVVWPPRTVVDLRSGEERATSPFAWLPGTVIRHSDLYDPADLARLPHGSGLLDVYRGMMALAGPGIAGLVEIVADGGPTYIHCAAGKDRTGAAVAALLLLAGVTEEAVVADYRRTEGQMDAVLDRLVSRAALVPGAFAPAMTTTPEEAISLVIDEVTSYAGGPTGWFLANGAAESDIERFLARFAER